MNLYDVLDIVSDDDVLLAFLQTTKLILCEKICEKCFGNCSIIKKRDKFFFSCVRRSCRSQYTVTPKNFWLHNARLPYKTIFLIIYHFVNGFTSTQIVQTLSISSKTCVDWLNFCRQVCFLECLTFTSKIGGIGTIVEIDESIFVKQKYHHDKFVHCQWVIGGVERGSKNCFLVLINNRNSETLTNIIAQNVLPGTTIITDCWKGYKDLHKFNFQYLTVNHSLTFKNELTGAHTNTIEGTWSAEKLKIPKCKGKNNFVDYLSTFMWLRRFNMQDRFLAFVEAISHHFP